MLIQPTPHLAHLFVCSNVRDNNPANPGCGAKGGAELKVALKAEIKQRGWKIRVSTSGCMGLCADGPNILLHPPGIHFSGVTLADLPQVLKTIESSLPAK